jgi:16S rRNA (guanine527-N7)-methyltransferase
MPVDIAARLKDRAGRAGIVLPALLADGLAAYFEALNHWNEKINLTALSDPDEAVDRLLLEPVAAAAHLSRQEHPRLMDLGSGGGSPAIPLALALKATDLVMVESKHRKAAFLREALRRLCLPGRVETVRFEELSRSQPAAGMDVVSVRAVRLDRIAVEAIAAQLKPGGTAALFRGGDGPDRLDFLEQGLQWASTVNLLDSSARRLTSLTRVG